MKYMKTFSEHEIFRELVKNCEVLLYSLMKSLDAPAGIDGLYLISRNRQQQHIRTQIFLRTASIGIVC